MRFYIIVSLICVTFAISLLGNAMATGTDQAPGPGVKPGASQPVQAGKETTTQQIAEYRDQIQAKLKDLSAKIEQYKIQADKATGDLKVKLNNALADLESKRQAAQDKLAELQSSGSKTWARMKAGLDAALEALQASYDRATKQLRE